MSALVLSLVLSLAFSLALLAFIAALLVKNAKKNKIMRAAAKRSRGRYREAREVRKTLKRRDKTINRVFRIYNDFIVKEVQAGSADQLENVMSALTEQEIRNVRRTSMMGIARLLIERGRPEAAVRLLRKYIQPKRSDQLLYFLEPLLELDRLGLLQGELHDFCNTFQSSPGARALDYLSATYDAVDEADRRNFQQLVVGPLSGLPRDDRNLMDIRFSLKERQRLLDRIRQSVIQETPLSLLRLGDGEAYAYPPGSIEGFEPAVFEEDNTSFELDWWNARPTAQVRDDVTARTRQAVARCDVLGFPSIYRIIRDLPPPNRRYGKNRNQRAFMRLLGALGQSISLDGKVFTEERCHRIKGALDAPFLFELAGLARSVVLVTSWPELSSRFPPGSKIETIAIPAEDADIKIFDVYPEIVDRIRAAAKPGTVVLVGSGIIGKILVDEARMLGAVALDVGSLMDYMMGRKTRTIADLI